MELIKEIYENDIGCISEKIDVTYDVRKASRAIVFNDLGKIALLFVSKNNYHKLPGGGIEYGEDILAALNREVMEEVGVSIDVLGEIGVIVEYRNEFKQLQISYCYYSIVKGEITEPTFTSQEISDGFKLKWVSLEEAISIIESDKPDNYMGKFIKSRDLLFLKRTNEILKSKI